MTTQSPGKERKWPHPQLGILWLSLLPVTGLGTSAPPQGIMGSQGSKVLFAISVGISWQRHRGPWTSQIPAPEPSGIWESFYPRRETAQEFIGSCLGFLSFFFFSFYWAPAPFLMQRRPEPGKHKQREGKSLFPPLLGAPCSLSSLSRQVCEQHLAHQYWVCFHMVSKV